MLRKPASVPPFKVYLVTSPFELPNSGDSDYVEGICSILGNQGVHLTCHRSFSQMEAYQALREKLRDPKKAADIDELEALRISIVNYFIRTIVADARSIGTQPVLNLQIRPPDTGMMISPEDLERFKSQRIKIVITCHEYRLNADSAERLVFNEISQRYFEHADHVVFFNEQDRDLATGDYIKNHGGKISPNLQHLL